MLNPFGFFDKTYIISAEDDAQRRLHAAEAAKKLDITFDFFDAVMGAELNPEEIEKVYDKQQAKNHKTIRRPLSKPEIGCALSHIGIYKDLIKNNLNHALILEDDFKPVDHNLNLLTSAIRELPEAWDLLYLGTLNHDAEAPALFKLKMYSYYPLVKLVYPQKIDYSYSQLWNIYPQPYSNSLKKAGYHQGTQAYAISKSGAEKFLAYHNKIVTPMDYMLSVMTVEGELNAFITKEILFEQELSFESSIENSRNILYSS